jgi:hypothetical protein
MTVTKKKTQKNDQTQNVPCKWNSNVVELGLTDSLHYNLVVYNIFFKEVYNINSLFFKEYKLALLLVRWLKQIVVQSLLTIKKYCGHL